jgi:hypothetical protein
MERERGFEPEPARPGRLLEGREKERFSEDLSEFVAGLEAALSDPELPDDERRELEEELAGLRDSLEAIKEGGNIRAGID